MSLRVAGFVAAGLVGLAEIGGLSPAPARASANGAAQVEPVAIVGVTVVDPASGTRRGDQTVVTTAGTIAAIGPSASTPVPDGTQRVDGRGRFLIPGLWDMHVHLSMIGREALAVFVATGITGVRDMGGNPRVVLPWRDSVAAGTLVGPRIRATGNIVESARWLDNVIRRTEPLNQPELLAELRSRFRLETEADAVRAVDSLARMGADHIKIRNFPSPAVYGALARAARDKGLPIVGHAPLPSMIVLVSDSGFASIEHGTIAIKNGRLVDGFSTLADSARIALFRRFARNGTAWDPTLVSARTRFIPDTAIARIIADSTGRTNAELRHVSATLRQTWRAAQALASVSENHDWRELYRDNLRDVRAMTDAGMLLLAGTDVAVTSLVPGFSLHDELAALVEEGHLTPAEALRTATVNPATVMKLGDRSGRIVAGAPADLVLLDADPLENIRATRRIHGVMTAGIYRDRAALDRLLK